MRKIKALLLGYSDSTLAGHAFHGYQTMPDCYDKRVVLFRGSKENSDFVIYPKGSLKFKFLWRYRRYKFLLKSLFRYGELYKVNSRRPEYFFRANEDISESADSILKKCGDFVPEVIFVYWVSEFVSYKTLRELHKKTGAYIVIKFVDQAPLGGGCHYPVDCEQYKTGCQNCPALLSCKKVAAYNLNSKIEALKGVPHAIMATSADIAMAKQTVQFKDSVCFESARIPHVERYDKSLARSEFGIGEDEFVILLGAQNINDVRKGIKYGLDAIGLFTQDAKKVTVLALGKKSDCEIFKNINAKVLQPGFLDFSGMCKAYCASDCYLNTTIADSGPMMVNYALTLGVPTISFPIGIAQTMVIDGKTGYMAEYKNPVDMAEKLSQLYLMSEKERTQMKENSKILTNEISQRKSLDLQFYDYYIKNILLQ